MARETLYLIPTPLGDMDVQKALPRPVLEIVKRLDRFIVENEKSAWRFLSRIKDREALSRVSLSLLDEHTPKDAIPPLLSPAIEGFDLGLISEAGCPGIADPGAPLAALAREKGMEVRALIGPCSIVLALMASGFPGQSFAFNGYLPQDRGPREALLMSIERRAKSEGSTQIFIETPYRNDSMLESMARVLDSRTRVCAAADMSLETETVLVGRAGDWRENLPKVGKRPAVFLIAVERKNEGKAVRAYRGKKKGRVFSKTP